MLLKIVSIIVFLIGLSGILLVIGAGQLKTEEDRLNEIKEELEYWNDYEMSKAKKMKNKRQNSILGIIKKLLHIY